MANLTHILTRAARRQMLNRALRLGGAGAAGGAAAALVLLAVDRAFGIAVPWFVYAGLCAAGFVIGVIVSLTRRPDALVVATQLDRQMQLRDRLGSAVSVQRGLVKTPQAEQQAFAQWTIHDAERAAAKLTVRSAVPIRITNIWNLLLVLCAVLALGIVFIPRASRGEPAQEQARSELAAEQLEAERTDLQQSIQSTVQELETQQVDDPRVAEQLEALRELDQQLAEQPPDPAALAEARDESAARINDVAERLEEQAERDQQARDALARDFEKLEPAEAPPTTRELIEDLRDGDLDNVADELERLLEQSQQLDEAQRREAAESLRSTRDALQSDDKPSLTDEQMRRQLEQVLREQGLDERAIDELTEDQTPSSERELADELMSRGVEEPLARELADELHQRDQQRDAGQRSEQDRQTVRDALDRAAEQLDPRDEPPADRSDDDSMSPKESQPLQSQQQKPPADSRQPAKQPKTDQQSGDRNQDRPEQPQDQQPQRGQRQSDSEQQSQESQQPGDQSSSQQQQQQPQRTSEPQPGDEQQSQSQPQQSQPQPGESAQKQQPASDSQSVADEQAQSQQPAGRQQTPDENAAPQQKASDEQQPAAKPSTDPSDPQAAQPTPGEQNAAEQPVATQQPSDDGSQQSGAAQQDSQQPQDDEQTPTGQQQQQPTKSPAEMIRELQERRDAMDRWRTMSEQSKQRARDMAERMSDEQKQRWMRELQRQQGETERDGMMRSNDDQPQQSGSGGGPGTQPGELPNAEQPSQYAPQSTEPLDARGDEQGADQLISEWLSDQPQPDAPGAAETARSAEPVRRAQDFARRAVSESVVPKRYHRLIDRYFGRLSETVKSAGAASTSGDSATSSTNDDSGAAQP